MRNLTAFLAAFTVILGIVSGGLWRDLRADRQQIVDLQAQLAEAQASAAAQAAQLAALRATVVTPATPPVSVAQSAPPSTAPPPPRPSLSPLPIATPVPRPALPQPVVAASVRNPPLTGTEEERRADIMMQSDVTAISRVVVWQRTLAAAGQGLSAEQLQTLNGIATAELRRETEESLEIDRRTGPMDALAAARLREQTITRQHETNLRVLDKITPHLSATQTNALRTLFDEWVEPRLAAARAAREQAASSGH